MKTYIGLFLLLTLTRFTYCAVTTQIPIIDDSDEEIKVIHENKNIITDEGSGEEEGSGEVGYDPGTKIFYTKGWDASSIQQSEAQQKGSWTRYLDADRPHGFGEFEDVWRARFHFDNDCSFMFCRKPIAMEVGISEEYTTKKLPGTIDDIWSCTNFKENMDPTVGFMCMNAFQKASRFQDRDPTCSSSGLCESVGMTKNCTRCFNARVRYFCLESDRDCSYNTFVE